VVTLYTNGRHYITGKDAVLDKKYRIGCHVEPMLGRVRHELRVRGVLASIKCSSTLYRKKKDSERARMGPKRSDMGPGR
jgi:hypothetical protein